jgi:hypothetical protein
MNERFLVLFFKKEPKALFEKSAQKLLNIEVWAK